VIRKSKPSGLLFFFWRTASVPSAVASQTVQHVTAQPVANKQARLFEIIRCVVCHSGFLHDANRSLISGRCERNDFIEA